MATVLYLKSGQGGNPVEPKPNAQVSSTSLTNYNVSTDGGGQDTVGGTYYTCRLDEVRGSSNRGAALYEIMPGSAHYNHAKGFISMPFRKQTTIAVTDTFTFTGTFYETDAAANHYPRLGIYRWKADDTAGDPLYLGNSETEATDGALGTQTVFWNAVNFTGGVTFEVGDRLYVVVEAYINNKKTSAMTTGFGWGGASGSGYDSNISISVNLPLGKTLNQGVSVSELNTGTVRRLKKKFIMTFKNATAGASRGRQGFTVTDEGCTVVKAGTTYAIKLEDGARIVDEGLSFVWNKMKKIVEDFTIDDTYSLIWNRVKKIAEGFTIDDAYSRVHNAIRTFIQPVVIGMLNREYESFEDYPPTTTDIDGWTTTNAGYEVTDATYVPPEGIQYLKTLPTDSGIYAGHIYHALHETVDAGHPKHRFQFWFSGDWTHSALRIYFDNSGGGEVGIYITAEQSAGIHIYDGITDTTLYDPGTINQNYWYCIFLEVDRSTNTWKAAADRMVENGGNGMPQAFTHSGAFTQETDINRFHINPEYKYGHRFDGFKQTLLTGGPVVVKHFKKKSDAGFTIDEVFSYAKTLVQLVEEGFATTTTVLKKEAMRIMEGFTIDDATAIISHAIMTILEEGFTIADATAEIVFNHIISEGFSIEDTVEKTVRKLVNDGFTYGENIVNATGAIYAVKLAENALTGFSGIAVTVSKKVAKSINEELEVDDVCTATGGVLVVITEGILVAVTQTTGLVGRLLRIAPLDRISGGW